MSAGNALQQKAECSDAAASLEGKQVLWAPPNLRAIQVFDRNRFITGGNIKTHTKTCQSVLRQGV